MSQYRRWLPVQLFPRGQNEDQATIGAQEFLGDSVEQSDLYEGMGEMQSVPGSLVVNGSLIVLDPSVPGQLGKSDDDYLFFHVDPARLEVTAGRGSGYFDGANSADRSSTRRHRLSMRFGLEDGGVEWVDGHGDVLLCFRPDQKLLLFKGHLSGRTLCLQDSSQRIGFLADAEKCRVDVGILDGSTGQNTAGEIRVAGTTGKPSVTIRGADGDILLNGGDVAESFTCECEAEPGTVVELTKDNQLRPSRTEGSRTVVGVVSGAQGLKPALILNSPGPCTEQDALVAMCGRVWVKADAAAGSIAAGDLLISSSTTGHAMSARMSSLSNYQGCVVGKALTPLAEGMGWVLMVVALS